MAIDLPRLKVEIEQDPMAFQLKQMYDAGNIDGVCAALNEKRFAFMEDARWGEAAEQIKALGEEDSAAYSLLMQVIDPPSRAEQIWGNKSTVTPLDVLACMGA